MNLFILITTILLNAFLITLIIWAKRRDCRKKKYYSFILSIFFLILWAMANFLADVSTNSSQSLFWTRATFPASLFMLWSFLWFSHLFPYENEKRPRAITVHFLITCFFSILFFTNLLIEKVTLVPGFGVTDIEIGSLYPLTIILYLTLIGAIIINLYKKYKSTDSKIIHKNQIRLILWGWIAFFTLAISTNLILPFFTQNANYSKFGPLFAITMFAFTTLAIIKYQFLEIKLVIQKGLVFSILLSLLMSFYILIIFLVNIFFQKTTSFSYFFSAMLTTIIGVFSVEKLKQYFTKITDNFFFKGRYKYSKALHSLSKIFNQNIELDALLIKTCRQLEKIFRASNIKIWINENNTTYTAKNSYLQQENISEAIKNKLLNLENSIITKKELKYLIEKHDKGEILKNIFTIFDQYNYELGIILKLENKMLGVILLGPKFSGDSYDDRDNQLLKTLANQASVAVEKAQLFNKIQGHSKELELKVRKRTRHIKKIQEQQKQMMLEISHGLQTPLTVMKNEIDYLRYKMPKSKKLYSFEESIDRTAKFVQDLLALASLEKKDKSADVKKINLSNLIEDIVEYFSVVAKNQDIKIESKIEKNINIKANKRLVEELLNNFLANSIRYIGEGDLVSISLKLNAEKNKIIIKIKDNGIGINQKNINKIFNPFYRTPESKKNTKGNGLGLAICKKIVNKYKGEIKVKSKINKGTQFKIIFPYKKI